MAAATVADAAQEAEQDATEVLEFAFGADEVDTPIRVVCVRQRAHARNNNSADTSVSAGDATGHRSSGGAARVLCFFLRHNRDALQLRRRRVVELGCGLGVAGLYAARTAAAVTLTDGDERALALARLSYALSASVLVAPVRFAPLTWSAEAALAPLFAGDAAGGDCQADDGAAACALLPPLLLGADLLYYSDGVVALLETVAALLAAGPPGGLAVLASNPRYADWAADACAAAARLGLQPHALPIEAVVPPAELAHGWFQNTRLLLLWRAGEPAPPLAPGDATQLLPLSLAEGLQPGALEEGGWAAFGPHDLEPL